MIEMVTNRMKKVTISVMYPLLTIKCISQSMSLKTIFELFPYSQSLASHILTLLLHFTLSDDDWNHGLLWIFLPMKFR